MLAMGLTTFAEKPKPTRSDCHAWSASPNHDLLATVCGIEPAEPGFKFVKIEPHLRDSEWIKGKAPHPKGKIQIELKKPRRTRGDNLAAGRLKRNIRMAEAKNEILTPGKNTIMR
jgi:alpha-L-rhamnosidase